MPDSILARVKENGGVVMVTFVGSFVSRAGGVQPRPKATMEDVIAHIEHVRRVAGVEHVGLGGDYDGTTDLPTGLEDVSTYPDLLAALARRGWSDADLRKLAGENVLRALRAAERVAAGLQRDGASRAN